ncbi:restriction modification system DNA specificity domain-containing protein [Desulfovibrio sp. X2]|uniref:restriction endonuclease subunit S n=1 Tax=Desulfovibrio sp. X2 TaxID=941449 RepID=UPI000358E940|nr:restriction endonuclease subunit S [Desulfovibrio sp. X2]EPR43437.1 restriction modification system DNA specificity domain-containing protein [Desulfovibrio sp. X2]
MSNKLPTGWIETTLSEVFTFSGGGTPDKNNPLFWGGDIKWVSVKDVKEKYTYSSIDSITQDGVDNSATQIAKEGSVILITRISPGKATILKIPAAINQDLKIVNRFQGITSEFVYYLFLSLEKEVVKRSSGTTVLGVSLNRLGSIDFALPPLNEQNRIVAKIEELFSELDAGVENLITAKEQLGVYRQSLLKHAFEGKLTEEWRKENADKLESGEAILKRVKKERVEYFKKQLEQWEKDVTQWEADGRLGKKPAKPKGLKTLATISEEELKALPRLPEWWGWGRLGYITCGVEYGTAAKSNKQGKYPVLRMGNIQNGEFTYDDLMFTNDEDEYSKYKLTSGDVLFNRTNSPELVGKTAVYKANSPALFAGYLIRINQIKTIVNSDYLNFFLNSPVAKNHGDQIKSDGVNQSNINGAKLVEYPFPFCSLEEQEQITFMLLDRMSSSIESELEIEIRLKQCEVLRKSILEKAFSGNLVSQNPNDEPASKLLERIKQERKNAPKLKRTRKSKTKAKRITMANLIDVLATTKDWLSAQDVFRQCGVGDGTPTDEVEKLYEELKQRLDHKTIEIERRGDEDWLRLAAEG